MNWAKDTIYGYGCVECQEWHYEGDAEYQPHIFWQSKHGIQLVPIPPQERAFRAIGQRGEAAHG